MKSSLTLSALAIVLVACAYEDEPPRSRPAGPHAPAASSDDEEDIVEDDRDAEAGSSGSVPNVVAPMLAELDTNQTMEAEPGEGVGVFVEYVAGGHWHLWWTCDTAQSEKSCDFVVSARVGSGTISNLDASELDGGFAARPTSARVDAKSITTTQVHGIRFDTSAGATLTVETAISGLKDGSFLFFVQNGKVNGGFTGKLTNPLQLRGTTP